MSIRVSEYTSSGGTGGGISVTFATESQAISGEATHVAMNPLRTYQAITHFAKSPYEMWKDAGGVGTREDFLISISGIKHFENNTERNNYFANNPSERFTGALVFCNGIYQQWNGDNWINIGNLLINKNHFFTTETQKNQYFINKPDERQHGTIINVGGKWYVWYNNLWNESTAFILGKSERDDLFAAINDKYIYITYDEHTPDLMKENVRMLSNNVFIKETNDYLNGLLLTSVYNRSYDNDNWEVIGMNIYNYNDDDLPISTEWWVGRSSKSDQDLVKVYFLNRISVDESKTWQNLCDDEGLNLKEMVENHNSLDILKNSEEFNEALYHSNNGISMITTIPHTTIPDMTHVVDNTHELYDSIIYSSYNPEHGPWRVFSPLTDTSWVSSTNANEYIGFEFEQPIWLFQIVLTNWATNDNMNPKDFRLEYWDENDTIVPWKHVRNYTMPSNESQRSFPVGSNKISKKWRILILNNHGSMDSIRLARLQMRGFY